MGACEKFTILRFFVTTNLSPKKVTLYKFLPCCVDPFDGQARVYIDTQKRTADVFQKCGNSNNLNILNWTFSNPNELTAIWRIVIIYSTQKSNPNWTRQTTLYLFFFFGWYYFMVFNCWKLCWWYTYSWIYFKMKWNESVIFSWMRSFIFLTKSSASGSPLAWTLYKYEMMTDWLTDWQQLTSVSQDSSSCPLEGIFF